MGYKIKLKLLIRSKDYNIKFICCIINSYLKNKNIKFN